MAVGATMAHVDGIEVRAMVLMRSVVHERPVMCRLAKRSAAALSSTSRLSRVAGR